MANENKRTRKSNPLPKEARPRFEAVANRRVTAITKGIRSLYPLAAQRGKAELQYDYSDEDVTKLVTYLRNEIDALESKLNTPPKAKAEKVESLF